MTENVDGLITAGFLQVGKWEILECVLAHSINNAIGKKNNVLYAFSVNDTVVYIGKTSKTLIERMKGYKRRPSSSNRGGSTNRKNHKNILAALSNGDAVRIFALFDLPQRNHGEFLVDLAAGLEDSFIEKFRPSWNDYIPGAQKLREQRGKVFTSLENISKGLLECKKFTKADFKAMLNKMIEDAINSGAEFVDVRAGNLHNIVGGYPAKSHSMPTCCSVMREEMKAGDEVLSEPPKGKGASLVIRYQLPR